MGSNNKVLGRWSVKTRRQQLEGGVRARGGEARVMQALGDAVRQRELDLGVMELLDVGAARLGRLDALHLHDLDAGGASAVPGAHGAVALSDGAGSGEVA